MYIYDKDRNVSQKDSSCRQSCLIGLCVRRNFLHYLAGNSFPIQTGFIYMLLFQLRTLRAMMNKIIMTLDCLVLTSL